MQQIKWRIGCSGFSYSQWKDIFYPKRLPQKEWFEFYAQQFNTLELNVTFYRFPQLSSLQKWHQKSPPHFLFAVKVPKQITHLKKFRETEEDIKLFYDVLSNGLKEKLGPVLFQLPPKLAYSEEILEAILNQTNASFTNAIEFRNQSWWRPDVMAALGEKNITFCGVSFPGLEDSAVVNTACCYYRFHGVPKLYYSDYEDAFLQSIVTQIKNSNKGNEAYLYFNNTASTAALKDARFIQKLIS